MGTFSDSVDQVLVSPETEQLKLVRGCEPNTSVPDHGCLSFLSLCEH